MGYFKKYKFDKSKFKLGIRTFKTGVAVFIVLLVFGLFGWLFSVCAKILIRASILEPLVF